MGKNLDSKLVNKSDTAYESVKKDIINNELKGGEIISEKEFADKLQMSRTPVRSAFQKLAVEGFIKILPSRGAIIQEMSIKEANDIYDLRISVETFVLKKAFALITQKDINNLRDIIENQRNAYINGNIDKCMESMEHDIKFHGYFSNLYENNKIKEVILNFRERLTAYGYLALIKPGRIYTTLNEHEKVVDALEKRDLRAAIENLEIHFENAKTMFFLK